MAKIAKVTDLAKLEGDPDPRRADIKNPRMHLELHAHAPWSAGFVRFIALCSESSSVARAITVAILMVIGMVLAAATHVILVGLVPAWVTAIASVIGLFIPSGLYWLMARGKTA